MPKWFEIVFGVLAVALIAAGAVYINRPLESPNLAQSSDDGTVRGTAEQTLPESSGQDSGTVLDFGDSEGPPEFEQFNKPAVNSPQQPASRKIQIPPPILKTVRVTLETSLGDIGIELYGEDAPLTVGNFAALAQADYYDGTTFHRVIDDFMIQGGDSLSKDQTKRRLHGTGQLPYEIPDEINDRKLVEGSVAAANRGPDTNGSQFFIVTKEATPWLDGRHTNFGQVVRGMDVVEAISKVEKDNLDNPLKPVTIIDVVVEEGGQ